MIAPKTNGQFPGQEKRESNISQMHLRISLVKMSLVLFFLYLCYCFFSCFGAIDFFHDLLSKAGIPLWNRILSLYLSRCVGWEVGGTLLASFFAAICISNEIGGHLNMMPSGSSETPGWTSLLGSPPSGTETAGTSSSVNQPDPQPGSPDPVFPQEQPVDPDGYLPLQNDVERRLELGHRLHINSISSSRGLEEEEENSIVATQLQIEKKLERALLSEGYSRESLFEKRHRIRGFIFYPQGTPLSRSTYIRYKHQIENYGVYHSTPYRNFIRAIDNYELFL